LGGSDKPIIGDSSLFLLSIKEVPDMIKAAYLHIPFCEHICHYCDFNKVFLKGQPVDEYLLALDQEMKLTLNSYPTNELETIFVGGGTPTSLNESQLYRFCESINRNLAKNRNTEFTGISSN
jgi:oxygen-independent coproporphyrinogen-3 oxidase